MLVPSGQIVCADPVFGNVIAARLVPQGRGGPSACAVPLPVDWELQEPKTGGEARSSSRSRLTNFAILMHGSAHRHALDMSETCRKEGLDSSSPI